MIHGQRPLAAPLLAVAPYIRAGQTQRACAAAPIGESELADHLRYQREFVRLLVVERSAYSIERQAGSHKISFPFLTNFFGSRKAIHSSSRTSRSGLAIELTSASCRRRAISALVFG